MTTTAGAPMAAATRLARRYGVVGALALSVAAAVLGDQLIIDSSRRGPTDGLSWLSPEMNGFWMALLGYAIMLVAAIVFAAAATRANPLVTVAESTRVSRTPYPRPARLTAGWLAAAAVLWLYLLIRVLREDWAWHFPLVLLASVAIVIVLLVRRDQDAGVSFGFDVRLWEVLALAAVTIVAGLILSTQLATVPDSMWGDEGAFWTRARLLADGAQSFDVFAPGVYGFPLASSEYQAVFAKAFGYSLWSWRFSSVVAVVAVIPPTYFLVRGMFDRRVAFVAVALMVTSPYLLAFARLGYNNAQALFPVVSALLALHAAVERRSGALFFLAGALAGFGFYTYFAARLAVFVIGAALIYVAVTRRMTLRETAYALLLAAVGAVMLGSLVSLRALVEGNDDINRKLVEGLFMNEHYVRDVFPQENVDRYPSVTVSGVQLLVDAELWVRLLARGFTRTLLAFHRTDLVESHFIAGSLGGPVLSALLLPGLGLAIWSGRRSFGAALLAIWFVMGVLLLGVLSAFPPTHTHMVAIIPALAIVYAVAIVTVAERLPGVWIRGTNVVSLGVMAGAVGVFGALGAHQYFANANTEFAPPFDQIIWFRALEIDEDQLVMFVYDDPDYDSFVPFGINAFTERGQYASANANTLNRAAVLDKLRSADVVVLDAREANPPLDQVQALLPDWELRRSDDAGGEVIAWILVRSDARDSER